MSHHFSGGLNVAEDAYEITTAGTFDYETEKTYILPFTVADANFVSNKFNLKVSTIVLQNKTDAVNM